VNRGPHERGRGGSHPSANSSNKTGGNSGNTNGGGRSEAPRGGSKERVFSSPRKSMGRNPSEYRMRLERLRGAREIDDIRQAADAFLQHHQLPDDTDVLYKVLQHPNEKVVRDALGQISSLLMQGRIQANALLEERLKTLAEREIEPGTRSFVEGVQSQIRK
jgi:hypothetical protein